MPIDSLDTPIRFLKGVGPGRAAHFAELGVETVGDLLDHFPRRHIYFGETQPIADMSDGETIAIVGTVVSARGNSFGRTPSFQAVVRDDSAECRVRWFHSQYLQEKIFSGCELWLFGKVSWYRDMPQLVNPRFQLLSEGRPVADDEAEATYPATAELPSRRIASVIRQHLPDLLGLVTEWLDEPTLHRRGLPARRKAYSDIHSPPDDAARDAARRRLAYDELLLLELAMALRKQRWHGQAPAHALPCNEQIDERIRRRVPFEFTGAQRRVIDEIVADLARKRPMSRMLQGDVGSGKTVVALYAVLVAIANRCQAAVMAPTGILADQHFQNIEKYLAGSRVRRALLVGGMTPKRREKLYGQIAGGEVDLVVGTQALLEQKVSFPRLGVVVVDEQHRFGVIQRVTIRSKGMCPHYLIMTATPIPRSLALTAFGDLDVSAIDEMPPGRLPVTTRLVPPKQAGQAYAEIRRRLDRGEQAFIVYPLVEEDERGKLKDATAEAQRLAKTTFRDYKVGLVHGRMKSADKDAAMDDFRTGRTQVLVATTVVEVGVDVPNATVMAIHHADRFGLAQLHQLRGRIGRSNKPSVCLLLSGAANPMAKARLEVMCKTHDGFELATEDLRLRGPGQFFGTRQHGIPELKLASLVDDVDLLEQARKDAHALVATKSLFDDVRLAPLLAELKRRWGDRLLLADAG